MDKICCIARLIAQEMVDYYYTGQPPQAEQGSATEPLTAEEGRRGGRPPRLQSLQYCCVNIAKQLGIPLNPIKSIFGRYRKVFKQRQKEAEEQVEL